MSVAAVVPVKDFSRAKSRLAPVLLPPQRAQLSEQLFVHALEQVQASGIRTIAIIASGTEPAGYARASGAEVYFDREATSRRERIDQVIEVLFARGMERAIVCMSDLPWVQASELCDVLKALDSHEVVVCPDRHRRGTNVLGLRNPGIGGTCFGYEDSFPRHLARSLEVGCSASVIQRAGLEFDLDSPEDYLHYRAAGASFLGTAQLDSG